MDKDGRIYVAGASGLVGSAVVRVLRANGFLHVITDRVDLTSWDSTRQFFENEKPQYVMICAAKVGGILANRDHPATFITDNLLIQANLIRCCQEFSVKKFLFLGSSCIYPKLCPQPIREEYLLTGPLEPTNSAYAIAKIAGIEMVKAYRRQFGLIGICLMPTNLYGPHDNFSLTSSHVLPAMIRKFHEAKMTGAAAVELWGTGSPLREFLHVDDLARACLHSMEHYDDEQILNVGCGEDVSIKELASLVAETVGYGGSVHWDTSKPDGTPRKLLDVSRIISTGWKPAISLRRGVEETYQWFLANKA